MSFSAFRISFSARFKLTAMAVGAVVLTAPAPAHAEYRSFLLQIKSADGKETQLIKSTLDPDQYRGYFQVRAGDQVTYIETWRCKGNTANLPICKSPREIAAEQAESANNANSAGPASAATAPGSPP